MPPASAADASAPPVPQPAPSSAARRGVRASTASRVSRAASGVSSRRKRQSPGGTAATPRLKQRQFIPRGFPDRPPQPPGKAGGASGCSGRSGGDGKNNRGSGWAPRGWVPWSRGAAPRPHACHGAQPLAQEPPASLPTAPQQLGASLGVALPTMEHLVLGLVLLAGSLDAGSPLHRRDLDPVEEKALDMAPTSFDDQYRGCSRMMEEELEELNRTEFAKNSVYAEAWTSATTEWRNQRGRFPQPPALRPEHVIALLAYTQHGDLYRHFNAAVREAGRSREEYLGAFDFKVLHFLLSEALRVLRDAQPRRCHHVYRGVRSTRFTAQRNQSMRFGHFASTSLDEDRAWAFGEDTFFSVETCYGVPIKNFSFFPFEEEILIPPFERFQVTNVARDGHRALIQLRSQGTNTTHNCEFVKEKRCKDRPCDFSAGTSILGDPLRLWGLLLAATALAGAWGL
ncbi:erythroblast NAD(P)(+)--arginine ADP-ribosyltransferase-like isoform 2-T2 [Theristicus caerulescens]